MTTIRQQILNRINIDEYIGKYVQLKSTRPGESIGLCPFHDEKTPSFSVSSVKGFFHCFGCKASGDVIKFVTMIDNIDYSTAMQKLSEEIGLKFRSDSETFEAKKQYFAINNLFARICHKIVYCQNGTYGLNYLKERGLGDETISLYQLGYLPKYSVEKVLARLERDFDRESILATGLFKIIDEKIYSMFANRVIFPIFEGRNIIGFGGRIIFNNPEKPKPKYINSPDNGFFRKSEVLYGIHLLRNVNKNETVFLVEGYMDVISLANNGVRNAVGILGASVTPSHFERIWKHINKPTLCFDNDNAGMRAMDRAAHNALCKITPGQSITFLTFDGGKDPDEIMKSGGIQYWNEIVQKNTKRLADFIFERELSKIKSLNDPEDRATLRESLEATANTIQHNVLRHECNRYFNKLYWDTIKNKDEVKDEKVLNLQLSTLKESVSNLKQGVNNIAQNEALICEILHDKVYLLNDKKILEQFTKIKFINQDAQEKKAELLKKATENDLPESFVVEDLECIKYIIVLLTNLELQNIKSEITELSDIIKDSVDAEVVEAQIIYLKKQELDLKKQLDSLFYCSR